MILQNKRHSHETSWKNYDISPDLNNGFVVLRKRKVLDDVPSDMFSFSRAWHPTGWSRKLCSLPPPAWKTSHVALPGLLFVAATDTQGYSCALKTGLWTLKYTKEQSHIGIPSAKAFIDIIRESEMESLKYWVSPMSLTPFLPKILSARGWGTPLSDKIRKVLLDVAP